MIPEKIYWFLGYNNLALILEQDRKHWLLKTDKKLQTYDKTTGQMFEGLIDNRGAEIITEASKKETVFNNVMNVICNTTALHSIMEPSVSAFTYSPTVNGLLFQRIVSTNYEQSGSRYHFKLRLKNCETCILPFGGSIDEPGVFADTWLKTETLPELVLIDDVTQEVQTSVQVTFNDAVTNPVFYFPLNENLQPIAITDEGNDTYETDAFNDDGYIGYPLFWMTCDNTNMGPVVSFEDNESTNGKQLVFVGCEGNASKYEQKLYVDVDGACNATPDDTASSGYTIQCHPADGSTFTDSDVDFNVRLNGVITFHGATADTDVTVTGFHAMRMAPNSAWEYVDEDTYEIPMSTFDTNCVEEYSQTLSEIFLLEMDETVPFNVVTNDTGCSGILMSAANDASDMRDRFPYHLGTFDGLPMWYGLNDEQTALYEEYLALNDSELEYGIPVLLQYATERANDEETTTSFSDIVTYAGSMNSDLVSLSDQFSASTGNMKQFERLQLSKNIIAILLSTEDGPIYADIEYGVEDWSSVAAFLTNYEQFIENLFDHNAVGLPQTMCMYSIHNTPNSDDTSIDTVQVAALLLDPGLPINTESTDMTDSNYGRVYLVSNDPVEYENNATSEHAKPGRTVARICDIPTSIAQLTNLENLKEMSIVDKKYVRSEASFLASDQERLYNGISNRWVKPSDLQSNGLPVYGNVEGENNAYIFYAEESLDLIDLVYHNKYRETIQLNKSVLASDVSVSSIVTGGSGYNVGETGVIVVGGFSFQFTVLEIDENHAVTSCSINEDPDPTSAVNLSNFDFYEQSAGLTVPYQTSMLNGNGTGLTLILGIDNIDTYIPTQWSIYPDLYALVQTIDGLYMYEFLLDTPNMEGDLVITGKWEKTLRVADLDMSSNVGISVRDSYINSLTPTYNEMEVSFKYDGKEPTTIKAMSNASYVSILDTDKRPVTDHSIAEDVEETICVDLCKLYGRGKKFATAQQRTSDAVIQALYDAGENRYDSYVLWRWVDSISNNFEYVIVHRSFNNYLSTDVSSLLPENLLTCDKYVHSNPGTTLTWNVPEIGTMMWVYNIDSKYHERYYYEQSSRDLRITKDLMTWNDIDVDGITLIENDVLAWNILTNNPAHVEVGEDQPIYQQPGFVQKAELSKGALIANIPENLQPRGNWELIFPRVEAYRFTSIADPTITFNATKMQMLRMTAVQSVGDVIDSYGNIVNHKTAIVNVNEEGTRLQMYNPETASWDVL